MLICLQRAGNPNVCGEIMLRFRLRRLTKSNLSCARVHLSSLTASRMKWKRKSNGSLFTWTSDFGHQTVPPPKSFPPITVFYGTPTVPKIKIIGNNRFGSVTIPSKSKSRRLRLPPSSLNFGHFHHHTGQL
jgi:hypothetical protein